MFVDLLVFLEVHVQEKLHRHDLARDFANIVQILNYSLGDMSMKDLMLEDIIARLMHEMLKCKENKPKAKT